MEKILQEVKSGEVFIALNLSTNELVLARRYSGPTVFQTTETKPVEQTSIPTGKLTDIAVGVPSVIKTKDSKGPVAVEFTRSVYTPPDLNYSFNAYNLDQFPGVLQDDPAEEIQEQMNRPDMYEHAIKPASCKGFHISDISARSVGQNERGESLWSVKLVDGTEHLWTGEQISNRIYTMSKTCRMPPYPTNYFLFCEQYHPTMQRMEKVVACTEKLALDATEVECLKDFYIKKVEVVDDLSGLPVKCTMNNGQEYQDTFESVSRKILMQTDHKPEGLDEFMRRKNIHDRDTEEAKKKGWETSFKVNPMRLFEERENQLKGLYAEQDSSDSDSDSDGMMELVNHNKLFYQLSKACKYDEWNKPPVPDKILNNCSYNKDLLETGRSTRCQPKCGE